MLRIPYVPTAYPDETFGSLLTRLVLYNGTGFWRSLLEESGYGRRTISPFYAMPVGDDRLDRLLGALGYSYQAMLQKLTVLPFWMAFNNATRSREQISINGNDGSGTRLFLVGKEYNLAGARFCPACLIDDMDSFGEPYLHRHHQLPVALVCAKHGEWLRMSCKACGTTVLPFNKTLLRPPSLRCGCGQDLSGSSVPPPFQRHRLRQLSQFANDALSCVDAPWTMQQVRALLQARMGFKQRDFNRVALQLLEKTYGPMERSASGLNLSFNASDFPLKLRTKIGHLRSPEYCTLLSASGLTFEEFQIAVSAMKVIPMEPVRTVARPFTIEQARRDFSRLALQFPDQAISKYHSAAPRLYWLLRLRDNAWLQEHSRGRQWQIPSLEEDRLKVKTVLGDSDRSLGTVRNSGWLIRAAIRDNAWLQEWLKDRTRSRESSEAIGATRATRVQNERARVLSRALFSVLRTERRPARIHAGLLSKVVKISMHQAQHTIANCPPLQYLIAAVNAGKDRRMVKWAARTLINEGGRPAAMDVLLRAGLNTTRVNRQFAIDAIEKIAAGEL
jgi:hypothetical protein